MSERMRITGRRPGTAAGYADVRTRRMEWATLAVVVMGTVFVLALALSTIVAGR